MKIVIKESVHIPVEDERERTYTVSKVTGIFRKVYHTENPTYRWSRADIERIEY